MKNPKNQKKVKVKRIKKIQMKKKEIAVFINEQQAAKIIGSAKVITVQELARQTGVKISTANVFLKKSLADGSIKKVGGFSGHYVYQSLSQ